MPIVAVDGLSCSCLAWTFKLVPNKNTQRSAYSMPGHSPVHFTDQYVVLWDKKNLRVLHNMGACSGAVG